MKSKKQLRAERTCETCEECVYIGEGYFACMENDYELVAEDFQFVREPCEKWKEV